MDTLDGLKAKLTSENEDVLILCENYLDQRIEKERLRGESAEKRANIILTASGAASAFLVFFFDKLPDVTSRSNFIITFIYAASALWLARSVWYSIKSIHMQSRYLVQADSIFDFQGHTKREALKLIISSKLWELQYSIKPNSDRLFYVQRAQRALIVFIGWLLIEGLALSIKKFVTMPQDNCVLFMLVLPPILFFFFGDKVVEKRGIWNHN